MNVISRRLAPSIVLSSSVILLALVSYLCTIELRFTNVPSHGRGHYIRFVRGGCYISFTYLKRLELGAEIDSNRRGPGYGADDFNSMVERILYRYLLLGVYSPGGQIIVSFPILILLAPIGWRAFRVYAEQKKEHKTGSS